MNQASIDNSVAMLLRQLQGESGNCILVADENWSNINWQMARSSQQRSVRVFSNRYDIEKSARTANLDTIFNDFDFSIIEPHSIDSVFFRVSKERASSHYIINQAAKLLKPEGKLVLTGGKNDGLKTYVKQACAIFGDHTSAEKHGSCYLATVQRHNTDLAQLDDKNYAQTRTVEALSLQSKPGIFGWEKIDRGSAFLCTHLAAFLARRSVAPRTMLDLGCGYGYLSMQASEYGFTHITATDNNAAALAATTINLGQLTIDTDIIAGDAGDQINRRFDIILCNPPFHQGFSIDGDMTVKFLSAAKRLLSSAGQALFVVNNFIPLEHKAKDYFRYIEVIANNGSFKLVALSQ
jgi:16S rRNA (guanine1207-N2)-methyltransferase